MAICPDNRDCETKNGADLIDRDRRSVLRKMAVGAVAVAGCSMVPEKWTTPLAEFAVLPAHAATSGYAADPPFTKTEVIEKSGVISIDKILRLKFVSPKLGKDYGSSMKIVFDTGGEIHVPDTSYDVITKEKRIYRTGGRRPDIPTMEVYAEPESKATKIIIHFMG